MARVRGHSGLGPGRSRPRRGAEERDSAADLAASRGWWVGRGAEVADRTFDPRLAAARVTPKRCDLFIEDAAEGFVAESWSINGRAPGSPLSGAASQHVLRVSSPSTPRFLVRGVPRKHELRFFPREFRNQSGFVRYHVLMMVAGDFAEVQDRLAPMIEDINRSRLWVVGLDGELVLMSSNEPDGAELERRVALARALVAALA
ncbi:MAG: hypothetical protein L0H93_07450 [Nocardioides sp.]|nr:hypothetical protein [Nocardioides sp.]